MTSNVKQPFIHKITKYIPLVEKIFLLALMIGIILTTLKIDFMVMKIAVATLGVIFFISAYRPSDFQMDDDEKFELQELLGLVIVPKALWLGCAVSAFGIAFYLFDLGNDGYKRPLIIGCSSIGICIVLLGIFFANGVKHLKIVMPILYRAVPLLAIDLYLLFSSPTLLNSFLPLNQL